MMMEWYFFDHIHCIFFKKTKKLSLGSYFLKNSYNEL